MNKYYEQIELEFSEDPNTPEKSKPEKPFDGAKLMEAENTIRMEIGKIRKGTSNYHHYAVEPGSFGFPAANQLTVFMEKPCEKTYQAFKEIAVQDFGALAGNYFMELIDEARKENNNE
jgi:hypothetical protein